MSSGVVTNDAVRGTERLEAVVRAHGNTVRAEQLNKEANERVLEILRKMKSARDQLRELERELEAAKLSSARTYDDLEAALDAEMRAEQTLGEWTPKFMRRRSAGRLLMPTERR